MHLSYVTSCSHIYRKFSLVDIDLNGALSLLPNLALVQVVHNPDVPAMSSVIWFGAKNILNISICFVSFCCLQPSMETILFGVIEVVTCFVFYSIIGLILLLYNGILDMLTWVAGCSDAWGWEAPPDPQMVATSWSNYKSFLIFKSTLSKAIKCTFHHLGRLVLVEKSVVDGRQHHQVHLGDLLRWLFVFCCLYFVFCILYFIFWMLYFVLCIIFIGPESDHWQCLSLTDWLPNSLTP